MDRIAEKGRVCLSSITALNTNTVSIKKAMKLPEGHTPPETKNGDKLKNLPAWDFKKVEPKASNGSTG